jgi:transposase
MVMLADQIEGVIGVDTHADTHSAVACTSTGALLASQTSPTTQAGLEQLVAFGVAAVPGPRVWAVEGCGSYGAGLTALLVSRGEHVVEVLRPRRAARPRPGKSDVLDALRAAREALACERPASPKLSQPVLALALLLTVRASAIQARTAALNLMHALVTAAPPAIREPLRGLTGKRFVDGCWMLPTTVPAPEADLLTRTTIRSLVAAAERVLVLNSEIDEHDRELTRQVDAAVPRLVTRVGIGPVSAAQLAVTYGHHGRVHSPAAFARLTGAAPIEASSGKTQRHRLNRGGDRNANHALHTIALTRIRHDPATRAYVERRRAEGKTDREIIRCLKTYISRSTYRDLKRTRHALDAT